MKTQTNNNDAVLKLQKNLEELPKCENVWEILELHSRFSGESTAFVQTGHEYSSLKMSSNLYVYLSPSS